MASSSSGIVSRCFRAIAQSSTERERAHDAEVRANNLRPPADKNITVEQAKKNRQSAVTSVGVAEKVLADGKAELEAAEKAATAIQNKAAALKNCDRHHTIVKGRRVAAEYLNKTMDFATEQDLKGLNALQARWSVPQGEPIYLEPSPAFSADDIRILMNDRCGQTKFSLDEVVAELCRTRLQCVGLKSKSDSLAALGVTADLRKGLLSASDAKCAELQRTIDTQNKDLEDLRANTVRKDIHTQELDRVRNETTEELQLRYVSKGNHAESEQTADTLRGRLEELQDFQNKYQRVLSRDIPALETKAQIACSAQETANGRAAKHKSERDEIEKELIEQRAKMERFRAEHQNLMQNSDNLLRQQQNHQDTVQQLRQHRRLLLESVLPAVPGLATAVPVERTMRNLLRGTRAVPNFDEVHVLFVGNKEVLRWDLRMIDLARVEQHSIDAQLPRKLWLYACCESIAENFLAVIEATMLGITQNMVWPADSAEFIWTAANIMIERVLASQDYDSARTRLDLTAALRALELAVRLEVPLQTGDLSSLLTRTLPILQACAHGNPILHALWAWLNKLLPPKTEETLVDILRTALDRSVIDMHGCVNRAYPRGYDQFEPITEHENITLIGGDDLVTVVDRASKSVETYLPADFEYRLEAPARIILTLTAPRRTPPAAGGKHKQITMLADDEGPEWICRNLQQAMVKYLSTQLASYHVNS